MLDPITFSTRKRGFHDYIYIRSSRLVTDEVLIRAECISPEVPETKKLDPRGKRSAATKCRCAFALNETEKCGCIPKRRHFSYTVG